MLKSNVLFALALGGAALVGCNKDENKPAVPTTPPAVPSSPQATTPPAPETPGPATRPSVPDVPVPALPPVPSTPATTPAALTPDAANADAQSLMDKVEAAVKSKNWDEADSLLKKLEAMKDKLPPDMQTKLASLRTAVDAGKSVKLPGGLPGLPDNK